MRIRLGRRVCASAAHGGLTASLMQMFLSSSIRSLRVSSSASCRARRAASMSFLAVWELSDSWEPGGGPRQHVLM